MFLEKFNQQNNGNYTMLSSGVSAAYMWSLSNDKVIILGSMLSWSYQLSGDSQANNDSTMRVRNSSTRNSTSRVNTGTRTAGQINNTLNGDDNYGQLVIYTAYDLTSTLSLDVDFTKNVATQNNEQSWSVGLSYSF